MKKSTAILCAALIALLFAPGCARHRAAAETLPNDGGFAPAREQNAGQGFFVSLATLPALPLQERSNTVRVTVRNAGEHACENAALILRDETGGMIGEAKLDLPPHGETIRSFAWTPKTNGWKKLSVELRPASGEAAASTHAVPVVSRELYFPWFGGGAPEDRELRFANMLLTNEKSPALTAYWKNRGVKACLWKGAVMQDPTPEAYAAQLKLNLTDPALPDAPDGIMIDEMGGYDDFEILSSPYYKGLKLFTEKNPQYFTALYLAGSLRYPHCNLARNVYRKIGVNLLMLECYSSYQVADFRSMSRFTYYDQRIAVASQQDVLSNTIMVFSVAHDPKKFPLDSAELEEELRYVRRKAPEMPGAGFFASNAKPRELVLFADDLCRRYFVNPLIQVYPHDLQILSRGVPAGTPFLVRAAVYNLGAMDARGVKIRLLCDGNAFCEFVRDIPSTRFDAVPQPLRLTAALPRSAAGHCRISIEIIPSEGAEVLDGRAEKDFYLSPREN